MPGREYAELKRRAEQALKTKPRGRPDNVKERIVVERGYKNIKLNSEDVAEFDYTPTKCKKSYRDPINQRKSFSE